MKNTKTNLHCSHIWNAPKYAPPYLFKVDDDVVFDVYVVLFDAYVKYYFLLEIYL